MGRPDLRVDISQVITTPCMSVLCCPGMTSDGNLTPRLHQRLLPYLTLGSFVILEPVTVPFSWVQRLLILETGKLHASNASLENICRRKIFDLFRDFEKFLME